ncbi:MAG: alkaline phosphatase D family protein [Bacteroidota bacterium]|nr:alkaline phosphatase D family protein [Bacteroidota bacterium]
MKFIFSFILIFVLLNHVGLIAQPTTTIAFGSCMHQDKPAPLLKVASDIKPDYFIFLGDNIYGDTENMDTLQMKYNLLAAKPEFQKLTKQTQILATWDDHDYGKNDGGKEYPQKEASKQLFLKFWGEPDTSSRFSHQGIYHAKYIIVKDKIIQILLLDTRTFRDSLIVIKKENEDYYLPNSNPKVSLLGSQQWQWVENELGKKADIRIIASSTQFGISHNGYEAWANFPKEQHKMLELIKKTKAKGVFFISGDVHYAELSKINYKGLYPIYDLTSSGITQTWDFATPNSNRIGTPVMENNIGLIRIKWNKDPEIQFQIIDGENKVRIQKLISLSDLK